MDKQSSELIQELLTHSLEKAGLPKYDLLENPWFILAHVATQCLHDIAQSLEAITKIEQCNVVVDPKKYEALLDIKLADVIENEESPTQGFEMVDILREMSHNRIEHGWLPRYSAPEHSKYPLDVFTDLELGVLLIGAEKFQIDFDEVITQFDNIASMYEAAQSRGAKAADVEGEGAPRRKVDDSVWGFRVMSDDDDLDRTTGESLEEQAAERAFYEGADDNEQDDYDPDGQTY